MEKCMLWMSKKPNNFILKSIRKRSIARLVLNPADENGGSNDKNERNVTPECRICQECASLENPLISPCQCTGSMSTVHTRCLETWIQRRRFEGTQVIDPMSALLPPKSLICEVCRSEYNVKLTTKIIWNERYAFSNIAYSYFFQALMMFFAMFGMPVMVVMLKPKNKDIEQERFENTVTIIFLMMIMMCTSCSLQVMYKRWLYVSSVSRIVVNDNVDSDDSLFMID